MSAALDPVFAAMDRQLIALGGVPATLHPQSGGSDVALTGIIQPPAMAEDYVPGSPTGTSLVRYFIRFADLSSPPLKGDRLTLNGVNYDVYDVLPDVVGSAVLKLRRYA